MKLPIPPPTGDSQDVDDIGQKPAVVAHPDTVPNERAVVVHHRAAPAADAAVLRPGRAHDLARVAQLLGPRQAPQKPPAPVLGQVLGEITRNVSQQRYDRCTHTHTRW